MTARPFMPAMLIATMLAASAGAQTDDDNLRPEFAELQVVEHRGEQVPLDATFTDEQGNPVKLGDLITGERPVLMALVYYRCPMLCTLVANGMTAAIKQIPWTPGQEYEVVVISFDHTETPKLAELKKRTYVAQFNRPGSDDGWHFLVGQEDQIRRVSDALGFPFKWSQESEQFSHPSCIFVLTPEGRISKYLYGVNYEPKTVRLSLVEASDRKIGTVGDRVLLLCSHYDSTTGRYTASVMKIVNLSAPGMAAAVVLILVVAIRRRKAALAREAAQAEGKP